MRQQGIGFYPAPWSMQRVEFPSGIHGGWDEAIGVAVFGDIPDARDTAKPGTPEREAANREHEAAFVVFRALAEKIRPRSS